MVKLNERQQRFVDEYIKSGIAYAAALAAGYSETYAKTDSHTLLENPRISAAIEKQMESIRTEKIADQQEILEALTKIGRGQARGTALVGVGKGAQEVEDVPPTISEQTRAWELLGKRHALWTDKQEVTQRTIEVTVGDYSDED